MANHYKLRRSYISIAAAAVQPPELSVSQLAKQSSIYVGRRKKAASGNGWNKRKHRIGQRNKGK
jgi:DNA replicative helicase MCM subunit Mcm2 (Cdc46/Mcm family)